MKITKDMNFYIKIAIPEPKIDKSLFLSQKLNKVERSLSIAEIMTLGNEYDDRLVIPYYQRNLVWSIKQKTDFIKSIFARNNLGTMIFKREKIGNCLEWSIIDGLQRYTTIKEFIECKFRVYDVCFDDLIYDDKYNFITTKILIEEYSYMSEKDEINLYINKNFGGTAHNEAELKELKNARESLK